MRSLASKLLALALMVGCVPATGCTPPSRVMYCHTLTMTRKEGSEVRVGECSSTAIAPHTLLTAAHCVSSNDIAYKIDGVVYTLEKLVSDTHDHSFLVFKETFKDFVPISSYTVVQGDEVVIYGSGEGIALMQRNGIVSGFKMNDYLKVPDALLTIQVLYGDSGAGVFHDGMLVGTISYSLVMDEEEFSYSGMIPMNFTDEQRKEVQ